MAGTAAAAVPASRVGRSTSAAPPAGHTGAGAGAATPGREAAAAGPRRACPGTSRAPAAAGRWWSRGTGGRPAWTGRAATADTQNAATDPAATSRRSRVSTLAPRITECTSPTLLALRISGAAAAAVGHPGDLGGVQHPPEHADVGGLTRPPVPLAVVEQHPADAQRAHGGAVPRLDIELGGLGHQAPVHVEG